MKSYGLKIVSLLLFALLLVVIWQFGVRIELFLLSAVLACIFYFVGVINTEHYVLSNNFPSTDPAKKMNFLTNKGKLFAVVLFGLLFVISCFWIRTVQNPRGKTAYFTNADHSALANTGFTIKDQVVLKGVNAENPIFKTKRGLLKLEEKGQALIWNNFFEPVFSLSKSQRSYTPVNNVYKQPISKGWTIKGDGTVLELIDMKKKPSHFWLKRKILNRWGSKYSMTFRCSSIDSLGNSKGAVYDTFKVVSTINVGMRLGDLLKRNPEGEEISQVAYASLEGLYQSYFLANEESNFLSFFPNADSWGRGYRVFNNNNVVSPSLSGRHSLLESGSKFYIGFAQTKDKMILSQAEEGLTLSFQTPELHSLRPDGQLLTIGNTFNGFLINNYQNLAKSNLEQGFLFDRGFAPSAKNKMSARISYELGEPYSSLNLKVRTRNKIIQPSLDGSFIVPSERVSWNYQLVDFSKNRYTLQYQFIFLGFIFLGFVLTLMYNPGNNQERIEPIVYYVIYTFLVVRQVMLWRLTTFPPTENISQAKLDNLLYYDTHLMGYDVFFPNGILFTILFILGINMYRWLGKRGKELKLMPSGVNKKLFVYTVVLVLSGVVFTIFKSSILGRLFAILIPLALYFKFSYAMMQHENAEINYEQLKSQNNFINYLRLFFTNLFESKHFFLSLMTLGFLAYTDKGFCVLFLLFLFLRKIIISFVRNREIRDGSILKTLVSPRHYWIYSLVFLFVYLIFVGFKPTFYVLLNYKFVVLSIVLALGLFIIWLTTLPVSIKRAAAICVGIGIILIIIPFSRSYIDGKINNKIKHTKYRASILFEPIENLISETPFTSFDSKKIIQTAQNQWFINSYISKKIDYAAPVNLRGHFSKGVNYITQTRDLVLPRFFIAEYGRLAMYLILALSVMPILILLLSFPVFSSLNKLVPSHYLAISVGLLFCTIGFFVWMTSTNRFVFFGQDFPFFSLTSKIAVLLPLFLFTTILLLPLQPKDANELLLKAKLKRGGLFALILLIIVAISGRSNVLNERSFNINLANTHDAIDAGCNEIVQAIQSEMNLKINLPSNQSDINITATQKFKKSVAKVFSQLKENEHYKKLLESSDPYTRSILELVANNPVACLKNDAPAFIRYVNGNFVTTFNQNIYLELPAYNVSNQWRGQIYSNTVVNELASIQVGNKQFPLEQLPARVDYAGANIAVLPKSWLPDGTADQVVISTYNPSQGSKLKSKEIQLLVKEEKRNRNLNMNSFAEKLSIEDQATILGEKDMLPVYFNRTGQSMVTNKWVNGKRRLIYPLGDKFFWLYHYANVANLGNSKMGTLDRNLSLTIDPDLQIKGKQYLASKLSKKYQRRKDFKFSVIAADGLGNIRLMTDYVANREKIDPNNQKALYELSTENYFASSRKNERDQWANSNLLNMVYGPGSSIKPIVLGIVSGEVNAGWERMKLLRSNRFRPNRKGKSAVFSYAGLPLNKKGLGWPEQHGGDNADCDVINFISKSNNFYHSLLVFLGSYAQDDFKTENGAYSLRNLYSSDESKGNYYPKVTFDGTQYGFKSIRSGGWPSSANDNTYFGNEQSILSAGFAKKYNLITKDIDKNDYSIKTKKRVNFADTDIFDTMKRSSVASYIWSFPEESYFLQKERRASNKVDNLLFGLKNPTAGGAPYELSPVKMVELFGRMFTQKNYVPTLRQSISVRSIQYADASWKLNEYEIFLKNFVYKGMADIFKRGTLRGLGGKFGGSNTYRGYHIYGKTGTTGQGGKYDSKRLAIVISKENLEVSGPSDKIYVVYIAAQEINDTRYDVYKDIIDIIMDSQSFNTYMK